MKMKTPEQVAHEIAVYNNGYDDLEDAVIRCEPLLKNHTEQGRNAFARPVKGRLGLPGAFIQIQGMPELELMPGSNAGQCFWATAA
ncbi:MAG: hypothetical protein JMN27_17860 [gamma proteobacterium endosymbiont of Lamellibrachia anaximandri]|nr:hypothetical protein [gamma proteobacterium endosymbiont of Lamellibrachia anaximandri]MBL3535673.1 hypothetical protein [gamma proteobacterium endosymbiont of Lamellibrachia anaximandri]